MEKPHRKAAAGLLTLLSMVGLGELPSHVRTPPAGFLCPRCGSQASQGERASYCLKQRCGWFEIRPAVKP